MKATKTILYLRTDLSDQELVAGGSVAHTLGVIQGFMQNGYQIVCGSSAMTSLLKQLSLQELVYLQNPAWLKFLRWKLNCVIANVVYPWQLRKLFKKYAFQAIYQRYSLLNMVGVLISWWYSVPLILEYNGSEVWVERHWIKKKWFKLTWLAQWIEDLNVQKAYRIIVVSQALKDDLIARHITPDKIIVNPNGVDPDVYDPEKLNEARKTIRTELSINDKFVFGFIGTFSYWHGVEVIAHMIPEVIAQNSRAHFLLIGDGPLKGYIQKYLEEKNISKKHVTFTGLVLQESAKNYLAACDAFLCPTQPNPDGSRFFGSPTKLFEYMSLAKPIIASDLEQLAEIIYPAMRVPTAHIDTSAVGFIVNPKNITGFVTCALEVMRFDAKNTIGLDARKKVIEMYSWQHHVKKIIAAMNYR